MLDKINSIIKKIKGLGLWFKKNTNRISLFITIFLLNFLVLSVYSVVSAQTDDVAFLDSNANFSYESDKVDAFTGTEGSNVQKVKALDKTAALQDAILMVGGNQVSVNNIESGSSFEEYGLLGTVDNGVTAMIYNPPGINIPEYLAREWIPGYDETGTSTLAADTGYSHFKDTLGIEPVWRMFRDIAYIGFVIVLVAAGFMIMFRSKINGQITVNLMNSLPNVFIVLILVTFSFAIVGLIVDLGRLLTMVFSNLLTAALKDGNSAFIPMELGGPFYLIKSAVQGGTPSGVDLTAGAITGLGGGLIAASLLGGPAGLLTGGIIVGAIGLLIWLIIAGIALFAGVKVFIALVTAYVKIIIDLIMGPIYILLGSLPGNSQAIKEWFKRLFTNTLVFPVIFFLLNVFRYIGTSDSIDASHINSIGQFMSGGSDTSSSFLDLRFVVVLFGYFFAANVAPIIEEMLQVNQSKGMATANQGTKDAMSKIPLVGGLFGK